MPRLDGFSATRGRRSALRKRRRPGALLAVLAALCGPAAALAQGFGGDQPMPYGGGAQGTNPFLGAWSSQQPGPSGVIFSTILYRPDGTYIMTSHLPNDTLTRTWGQYRVQQVGPNQWRLDSQVAGYLPQRICSRQIGGPTSCAPVNFPMGSQSLMAIFGGPGVMQTNAGETWQRDPSPVLLSAQVPAVGMQTTGPSPYAVAPMPLAGPTPSVVPYSSQGAQDFIHQRLKGCDPDPGTRHSYSICDQLR